MNLYGFVGNDGVSRWDLLGRKPGELYDTPYQAFRAAANDVSNSTSETVSKGLAEIREGLPRLAENIEDPGEGQSSLQVLSGKFSLLLLGVQNIGGEVAFETQFVAGIEFGTIVYCDVSKQKYSYSELVDGGMPTAKEFLEGALGHVDVKELYEDGLELLDDNKVPLALIHSHGVQYRYLNKQGKIVAPEGRPEELSEEDIAIGNSLPIPVCAIGPDGSFQCTGGQPRR